MPPEHALLTLLREALAMLAMPPAEQARLNGPGCLACDLMEDFGNARSATLGNVSDLTDRQRLLLDQIRAGFEAMAPADHTCFDNSVVERPAWAAVRTLAREALREFGWEQSTVAPFEQVESGVWRRPAAEKRDAE